MFTNVSFGIQYRKIEVFALELILELTYSKTSDRYRARYHNSKTILQELHLVLYNWHEGRIKTFQTVSEVITETEMLLADDDYLCYDGVSKKYFQSLLKTATDKKYLHLLYSTKLLITGNKDYISKLHTKVSELVNNANEYEFNEALKLNTVISYMITELINLGIDKRFIFEDVLRLVRKGKNFAEILNCIARYRNENKKFNVFFAYSFAVSSSSSQIKFPLGIFLTEKDLLEIERCNTNSKIQLRIQKYLKDVKGTKRDKDKKNVEVLGIEVEAYDYYSALKLSRERLASHLDVLKLGFPNAMFRLQSRVLVIDKRFNLWPKTIFGRERIDGKYEDDKNIYNNISSKLTAIIESPKITAESKEKILAGIRHLRQGNENSEIEQKFLNYWIGLEYIFSSYDANVNTIGRLKKYFPCINSLDYLHKHIASFVDISLEQLNSNSCEIEYLSSINNRSDILNRIKEISKDFPLLHHRICEITQWITDEKNKIVKVILEKHNVNLKQHLTRMYRVRNEIVHEAKNQINIESLASNLRYYLTYIIDSLTEYFSIAVFQEESLEQMSIEDYFIIKEIEYLDLQANNFKSKKLLFK